MRADFKILLLLILPVFTCAQQSRPDSLREVFSKAGHDSVRFSACWEMYNYYEELKRDSANYFIEEGLLLARKNNKKLAESRFLVSNAYQLLSTGRYAESLKNLLQAFSIIENHKAEKDNWVLDINASPYKASQLVMAYAHHTFANLMTPTLNTEQQIFHYREAMRLGKEVNNSQRVLLANLGLGRTYLDIGKIDSALIFEKEAERISLESGPKRFLPAILSYIGALYLDKGDKHHALGSFYRGVQAGIENDNQAGTAQNYYRLAKFYLSENEKDSALYYAGEFEQAMQLIGAVSLSTVNIGTAYEYLYLAYTLNNNFDSAFKYQGLALLAKDSISNARIKSLAEFQNLSFREQLRLQNLEKEKELYQSRVKTNAMLAGLGVFSIIALILYRNNLQKRKANKVLASTLENLQSTQAQLIQSEKMASLGELTAGIAHEIQNPLNFVNNFSEINTELSDEISEAARKGEMQEVIHLAADIRSNQEKINEHGKRAGVIIKGMLQHSRNSSGQKEPTDINALADEYLRLAYHGMKAKDKEFDAILKTDFDAKTVLIRVIPQDIGRVLQNIYNNAFYAVNERSMHNENNYEPTITVSTRFLGTKAEIVVRDNGNGIPPEIKEKIFQPFFTTKPTGKGTGLGLSLSYDIIKAHKGLLLVESTKGEGTAFTIQLPLV